MKTLKLTLVATTVAGLLVTASAQPGPGPGDANTQNAAAPAQPDANAPEAGAAQPAPGDAGGPPQMPVDANGQPQTPPDMNGQPPAQADVNAQPDANAQPGQDTTGGQTQPMPDDQTPGGGRSESPSLVITPTQSRHDAQETDANFTMPAMTSTNPDAIMLNFNNAPLEMVLNYLSDAAGFIIVLDTRVNGNVSIISKHPVTRQQAVDLLNAELNKNGYAAIRNDRMLTIVNDSDARTSDIPVKMGNDPDAIPKNAEIVTQIIPIRFVEARQLVSDLSSFVSPKATVVANEAGNSIVITDTQDNIRHLVEIIKAIDGSAEAETEIKVFPLKYASPMDVANELSSVFPSGGSSGSGTQAPIRFGGGPFGGGGGFARFFGGGGGGGGGGNNGNSSQSDRIKKETQVTAVADARTSSVIVTAPKDLMDEIGEMMVQLDVPSGRDQNVYTFQLKNGDAQQVATELQNMFGGNNSRSSSSSSSSQYSALQQRINNNTTSQGSTSSGGSSYGGLGGSGGRSGLGSQF